MPQRIENIINEFISGVNNILGKRAKKIILYGSYARGEQCEGAERSDIDVMILVNVPPNAIKQIQKAVLEYSFNLNLKYDILISPIVENVDVFNHRKEFMVFYKNVQKDGVLING